MVPEILASLRQRLPARWAVKSRPGGKMEIASPDRRRAVMRVVEMDRLSSTAIAQLANRDDDPTLVVASYLSPAVREQLQDAGINYLDLTGNTRIALEAPALFIERAGADRSPKPAQTTARSLKGDKAGRVVRALIDTRAPPGIRELAAIAGVDPGYATRVLTLLASENLIERGADENGHGRARSAQGTITSVAWPALLRRWAMDAPLEARATYRMYIAPRGIGAMLEKLRKSKQRHAVTGSLVATRIAPVAPPRLATIYAEDPGLLAADLDLTATEQGANVILLWSKSDLPFVRGEKRDGFNCAAVSQVAADLLSGPGRSPAEGDALIAWMSANEEAWRV